MMNENSNVSQPIDRLFSIIEYLAQKRLPVRLIDISSALSIPQPTVLRYLRSLSLKGYVYHDSNSGMYALTWKMCKLSDNINTDMVLKSIVSPFLTELAYTFELGACVVIKHGLGTIYLDVVGDPKNKTNTTMRIGKNAPIHTTGSGKVILSSLQDHEIDNIINNIGLPRLTNNTITNKRDLFNEINKIRECGYGIDNEECEDGHKCISVPIYDYTGGVAAAISLFGSIYEMTDTFMLNELLPVLKEKARLISFRLGYDQ